MHFIYWYNCFTLCHRRSFTNYILPQEAIAISALEKSNLCRNFYLSLDRPFSGLPLATGYSSVRCNGTKT